jgi:hypothetical protein
MPSPRHKAWLGKHLAADSMSSVVGLQRSTLVTLSLPPGSSIMNFAFAAWAPPSSLPAEVPRASPPRISFFASAPGGRCVHDRSIARLLPRRDEQSSYCARFHERDLTANARSSRRGLETGFETLMANLIVAGHFASKNDQMRITFDTLENDGA